MRRRSRKERVAGFTVLELIAGVFILSIGIVGVSALISRLLWYTRFVESKATAAYLAQEGMEIVRNIRDGNWLECKIEGGWDETCLAEDWTDGLFCCGSTNCVRDGDGACQADYLDCDQLNSYSGGPLEFNGEFYAYFNPPEEETKFKRIIEIGQETAEQVSVCTTVEWTEQGKGQSIKACEDLYNWYEPVLP